jgi:glucose/arabinose dehydrogenase
MEIPLPVPEGAQVFHVVLHPGFPAAPYAYVSAEQQRDGVSYLSVLRVKVDSVGQALTVIEGLPIEQARFSNHSGSALAFCGDHLFLSTGDTDPYADVSRGDERLSIRVRAQLPGAPEGKILRYRLSGIDLEPAGVIAADPPVYAMGFRNVFGMGCDVETGYPLAADNGPSGLDQLRIVAPGSNHEWPLSDTRDVIARPLFGTGRAVIAPTGVVSRADPAGGVQAVVSAYRSQALYLLRYDEGSATGPLQLLADVDGGAYAVALDARGCVFYSGPTAIWRLDEPRCVR